MMNNLGEYLRSAREKKSLSLKDMSERTRISLTFLQALEEGDYSVIPGEVFVSGFLRSYAKELGLAEKEVMALYRGASDQSGAPAAEPAQSPPHEADYPADTEPVRTEPSVVSRGLLYALAAALVAAVLVFFIFGRDKQQTPLPETPESPVEETVQEQPVSNYTSVASETASDAGESEPATPARTNVEVRLTATAKTWYALKVDGMPRKPGLLDEGDVLDISADDNVLLDLGNAGGVEISLNGNTVGPFGPPGAVRRGILFTRERAVKTPNAVNPEVRQSDGSETQE